LTLFTDRIAKLARTIAGLEGAPNIATHHLAKAMSIRPASRARPPFNTAREERCEQLCRSTGWIAGFRDNARSLLTVVPSRNRPHEEINP
jgi:hypothetical protein